MKILVILCCLTYFICPIDVLNAANNEKPEYSIEVELDDSLFSYEEGIQASWLGYGLARAKWLMENVLANNPEAYTYKRSFEEEVYARESLAKIWGELKENDPLLKDSYLDSLLSIFKVGLIKEYVWVFFREDTWQPPSETLKLAEFSKWQVENIPNHYPQSFAEIRVRESP